MEIIQATVIRQNQALRLRARKECQDRDNKERVTGGVSKGLPRLVGRACLHCWGSGGRLGKTPSSLGVRASLESLKLGEAGGRLAAHSCFPPTLTQALSLP